MCTTTGRKIYFAWVHCSQLLMVINRERWETEFRQPKWKFQWRIFQNIRVDISEILCFINLIISLIGYTIVHFIFGNTRAIWENIHKIYINNVIYMLRRDTFQNIRKYFLLFRENVTILSQNLIYLASVL